MKDFYLKPKILSSFKNYSKQQAIKDITAGLIVAVIALPLSIALALASGVAPECGIYTAIAAGFIVAILGGSRVQIAGPTAAFATIVAGVVAVNGMSGLFIATVMAGILLVVMGVCKVGALIKFIPTTITVGFTAGIAVTLLIGQIKDFLGITYEGGIKPIETIEKIEANIEFIDSFSWQALLVGAVCLVILIVYPKFEKRVPPSLIAVVVSALMVKFIPAIDEGVYTIGELYDIPMGLPSFDFLSGIEINLPVILELLPNAITIALLAGIESLLSCVVADNMINSRHNSNSELVAQGFANIGSVFFGGIPATGAIARTAANIKNGGRTPIAAIVHSVVLLLVLLFLMPLAKLIPMPAIAAILFVVAYNMSEWRKFKKIIKTAPVTDIIVLVLTFALTVVKDLVVAIAIGMVIAFLFVIVIKRKKSKTVVDDKINDDGSVVYILEGALLFVTTSKFEKLTVNENMTSVTVDMNGVTAIDTSTLNILEAFKKKCDALNVPVTFIGVNGQPLKMITKAKMI